MHELWKYFNYFNGTKVYKLCNFVCYSYHRTLAKIQVHFYKNESKGNNITHEVRSATHFCLSAILSCSTNITLYLQIVKWSLKRSKKNHLGPRPFFVASAGQKSYLGFWRSYRVFFSLKDPHSSCLYTTC